MAKTYTKTDAVKSINDLISIAESKQYFRKAKQLRKWKTWFLNGCLGHQPSLKRYKKDV